MLEGLNVGPGEGDGWMAGPSLMGMQEDPEAS